MARTDPRPAFTVPALPSRRPSALRRLVVVLGDQLDPRSAAFDGFAPERDGVFLAEAASESEVVWSSKPRTALFLAAMRHFAQALHDTGVSVRYSRLDDEHNTHDLVAELRRAIDVLRPAEVVALEPGEWRLRKALRELGVRLVDDTSFYCSHARFEQHARGRKQLRMEFFYRELRREHGVLMDGDAPAGAEWNFDSENRKSFGAQGPGDVPPRTRCEPDALTREVLELVERRFSAHPGSLADFAWPVTPAQARIALAEFIEQRLARFGDHQDAMWTGEAWLYHSHISAALNLKLLDPREAVNAAERAYRTGRAPLAAVEGFVRQILGWREYVRGVYWRFMPQYLERNALGAQLDLPEFYWTGATNMRCVSEVVQQTLATGYAHHIQRLMVTGLFALLYGARPAEAHRWYLAVYVDAVEWVELPNTLGMSQFADGGVMASKPYVASGKYIARMSNYCRSCRFDPDESTGPNACPFTTLYWDFLARHRDLLAANPRMVMQLENLARLAPAKLAAIRARAAELRAQPSLLTSHAP